MSAAVNHLLRQIQRDPRLAYLIGPCSQSYELLTQEAAAEAGVPVEQFRADFEKPLKFQKWPSEHDIECRIEEAVRDALTKAGAA